MSEGSQFCIHTFEPVYNGESRILILGSFPSVKSRENNFYYGHPQNRFWTLLARILKERCPQTIEEKKQLLYRNHIALWDVIASCEIQGSSDSSIKNVAAADLSVILQSAEIQKIYGNGAAACKFFQKYSQKEAGKEIIKLPSTSPANAAWSMERLYECWKQIVEE